MDKRAFDGLARHIARRGVLQGILAVAGAALLGQDVARAITICDKKGPGGKCHGNGQCCSHRCKKKKGKNKGKCLCSQLGKDCASADDCCSSSATCDTKAPSVATVCCIPHNGDCTNSADCCGDDFCSPTTNVCINPF